MRPATRCGFSCSEELRIVVGLNGNGEIDVAVRARDRVRKSRKSVTMRQTSSECREIKVQFVWTYIQVLRQESRSHLRWAVGP